MECEVHLKNSGLQLEMETDLTQKGAETTGVMLHQLSCRSSVYMERDKGNKDRESTRLEHGPCYCTQSSQ